MPAAQRTIVIDRPVDQVFACFTDPSNDQKWRSHVKEITAQGPVGAGSTIHQVVAGPGGRGIPADIEVTTYEPPSRYAFKVIAGPARPVGESRFVRSDTGTKASFSLSAEVSGIRKLVMSKHVQKSMDGKMAPLTRPSRSSSAADASFSRVPRFSPPPI